MDLCIDIGNTLIKFGYFVENENNVFHHAIIPSDTSYNDDQYISQIVSDCREHHIKFDDVKRIIYCSVVPKINDVIEDALGKVFPYGKIKRINYDINPRLHLNVDEPSTIGPDLIADLSAALYKYGSPSLIIDLGTASKILLLDKGDAFTSCVFLPGMQVSVRVLSSKAALLPSIDIIAPNTLLEVKNTEKAISAATTIGHYEAINGLVNRYEKELGYKCNRIFTGGSAKLIKQLFDESYIYDEFLLLEGLHYLLRDYYD